jgi:MATE family multidrug resistance protein
MQLFTLYSYIMDGFAFAGEALSGRYLGEGSRTGLQQTIRHLFGWGGIVTLLFTLLYIIGGEGFLGLLTNEQSVIAASAEYFPWAIAIPVAGMAAFVWDGIYIGCTYTRGMLLSMLCAASAYFLIYFALCNTLGNHALWLAFISYLLIRGIVQTILIRHL